METRTPVQTDVIVEGESGLYVEPSDVENLRQAIGRLLEHPGLAESMGTRGRQVVLDETSLSRYTERLGNHVSNG